MNDAAAVSGEQPDRRQGGDAALFVPLAAVGDGDSGLLVGLTPDTNCNYWRPQFASSKLTQTIGLVLQPGQADGFTFCAGRFTGAQFGLMQAAWETYQQAFPRYFTPTPEHAGPAAQHAALCRREGAARDLEQGWLGR